MMQMVEKGREKEQFLTLSKRLIETTDSAEKQDLKRELARITFGERCENLREILR